MLEVNKEYDELLKNIDEIELVPEEELENMDFYELAFYMQTLNQLSELNPEQKRGEEYYE